MNREEILSRVENRLAKMEGVRSLEFLNQGFKNNIAKLEREAESKGAMGGMMRFVNEGLWETLKREVQVALVMELKSSPISKSSSLLMIKDKKGRVLGEWVNAERIMDMKDRKDIKFLGEDFVIYRNIKPEGEVYIVISEVDFPYLDKITGVENVTSASPSGAADEYLRKRLGMFGQDTQSHLVGFDVSLDK